MENPDLRMSVGMKPDQKGVRIRRVDPTAPESQVLKPSDVILSFDGIDIANDGTGKFGFDGCMLLLFTPLVIFLFVCFSFFSWSKLKTQ